MHSNESFPPTPRPTPVIDPAPEPVGPSVRTPELVPEPVSSDDPFKDDVARRSRPLPARPIGNRRPETPALLKLDPQASSRSARETNPSVQVTTKPNSLALQSSSRKSSTPASSNLRPAFTPAPTNDSVVTAAATRVVTKPRVTAQRSEHTVEPVYYNPLRDQ